MHQTLRNLETSQRNKNREHSTRNLHRAIKRRAHSRNSPKTGRHSKRGKKSNKPERKEVASRSSQSNHEVDNNGELGDLEEQDRHISANLSDTEGCWVEEGEGAVFGEDSATGEGYDDFTHGLESVVEDDEEECSALKEEAG